ncbi:hypothetical protein LY76DRAFT_654801, partial [Colletotrichum caudatum]
LCLPLSCLSSFFLPPSARVRVCPVLPVQVGRYQRQCADLLPPSLVRIPTQTPIAIQQPAGVPAGSCQPANPPTLPIGGQCLHPDSQTRSDKASQEELIQGKRGGRTKVTPSHLP